MRSLSPVGEQYLDFQPDSADGPFLESGDTIPAASTDLPESLSETVVAVNDVLRQIDDKKLRIVLGELSTAMAGTGDDIGRILDQGTDLLATLDAVWPETDRVITTPAPSSGSSATTRATCASSATGPSSSRRSCAATSRSGSRCSTGPQVRSRT